jgi:hypothetical protein
MPVKLLVAYNVKQGDEETYYRFVVGEFLPTAQSLGLEMVEGWHTAWGDYPERLIGLVAEDHATLGTILADERWREIEEKLARYVTHYQRRIVPYRSGFQFLKPE